MDGLDGRYNWHDGVDPDAAAFLANADSVRTHEDGETHSGYVGIYDADGNRIGDVGVRMADLPSGFDTVYRIQVADGRIVALDAGREVTEEWLAARE